MKIIFGLGNPGDEYAETRHNVGALVIDELTARHSVSLKKHGTAEAARINIGDMDVIIARGKLFMNESGQTLAPLASYFKINPEEIILIHDELDIPLGSLRITKNSGSAGHRGVASVLELLNSNAFTRIRVGIGPKIGEADSFVLGRFSPAEKKILTDIVPKAADAAERLIKEGYEKAASLYN